MTITILKGDCLKVMRDLSGGSIDCFICDLPYGCLNMSKNGGCPPEKYGKGRAIGSSGCAWDVKIDLVEFWKEIRRLRKSDNTPCLMFCTTKFGIELINSNPTEYRYDLVWNKQRGVSFLSANKMPMRSHEMIYVFSKSGAFYNRVDLSGEPYVMKRKETVNKQYNTTPTPETINEGTRCALSVLNVSLAKAKHKGGHPTEKPMELYKFLIERFCPVGGIILDPTAGSFNSCFAAVELGHKAIGIEKDSGFFNKGLERVCKLS
jgi:site-specific DNA-methyltransferase (adenine-specific)